ncbi:unnamed protein product [Prorocentrum cordatum]|nr:unnamed protein product [Polarella glacialis]
MPVGCQKLRRSVATRRTMPSPGTPDTGTQSVSVPVAAIRARTKPEAVFAPQVLPLLEPSRPALLEGVVEMHNCAKEMGIPMDTMRSAVSLFKNHATALREGNLLTDGYLTKSSFVSLVKQMLNETGVRHDAVEEASVIDRFVGTFMSAEQDCKGVMNFRDFAIWYSSHCFDENFLDAKEQAMRKLSRKLGVSPTEIDNYKRHFDIVDADGSGEIDAEEFLAMLYKFTKVPKDIGLPRKYVNDMFRAADTNCDGSIDFEDFVVFSQKFL